MGMGTNVYRSQEGTVFHEGRIDYAVVATNTISTMNTLNHMYKYAESVLWSIFPVWTIPFRSLYIRSANSETSKPPISFPMLQTVPFPYVVFSVSEQKQINILEHEILLQPMIIELDSIMVFSISALLYTATEGQRIQFRKVQCANPAGSDVSSPAVTVPL